MAGMTAPETSMPTERPTLSFCSRSSSGEDMPPRYTGSLRDPRLASGDTLHRLDFSSSKMSFSMRAVARS